MPGQRTRPGDRPALITSTYCDGGSRSGRLHRPAPGRRLLHPPRGVVHRLHADDPGGRPAGLHDRHHQPDAAGVRDRPVTETLSLDVPPVQRYLDWLRRLLFEGDFGLVSDTQQPVWDELKLRIPLTIKLISAATITSVVVGVCVGVVTALRQYSGFDYLVTFFTFVFFALPVFWVAVILKSWGGINFNDWLRDGAHFSVTFIVDHGHRRLRDRIVVRRRPMAPQGADRCSCGRRRRRPPRVDLEHAVDARPEPRPVRLRHPQCGNRRRRRRGDGGLAQHERPQHRARHRGDRHRPLLPAADRVRRGHEPVEDLRAGRGRHPRGRRRGLRHGRLRQGSVGAHGGGDGVPDVGAHVHRPDDAVVGGVLRRRR